MINKFINYLINWISPPPMPIELDWPKHSRQNLEQVSLDQPIKRWRTICNFNGTGNWH